MSTSTITKTEARTEIKRRALPKTDPERSKYPARHVMEAGAAELRTIAGPVKAARTKAAAKVVAAKAVKTPEQVAATQARKLAWDFRASEFKAGRKVTYADACAKFGTTPASK